MKENAGLTFLSSCATLFRSRFIDIPLEKGGTDMRLFALLFVLAAVCASSAQAVVKKSAEKELAGLVLVLDPGHGGTDLGACGIFHNGHTKKVVEDEYMYDVMLRVRKIAKNCGATVVSTITDSHQQNPYDGSPQNVIPPDHNERYALNGRMVHANQSGLAPRVRFANQTLWRHPGQRVVYLAIHFDWTPRATLQGVSVVVPKGRTNALGTFLLDEFRRGPSRVRSLQGKEYAPLLVSGGGDGHGERNLYVLSDRVASVTQRALIELGNFHNTTDVWRIRDPNVRQEYAERIVKALIRVNTFVPLAQCRGSALRKQAQHIVRHHHSKKPHHAPHHRVRKHR